MAAVHWEAAMSAFFILSRMIFHDESVLPLRKSSYEHVCNNVLEKDGVEVVWD
jgi:hypothetical protein